MEDGVVFKGQLQGNSSETEDGTRWKGPDMISACNDFESERRGLRYGYICSYSCYLCFVTLDTAVCLHVCVAILGGPYKLKKVGASVARAFRSQKLSQGWFVPFAQCARHLLMTRLSLINPG